MNKNQINDSQKNANSIRQYDKKHDLRFIKTEAGIQTAFICLLKEKNFGEITVQNILDIALINRKTFYNHYMDKYDLLEKMTNDLFQELEGFLAERNNAALYSDSFFDITEQIYKKIHNNREKILTLWYINVDKPTLYERLVNLFKNEYLHMVKDVDINCDINFQVSLYTSIQMGVLKYLLESNQPFTCKKMIKELKIFSKTISHSTKLNSF